MDPRVHKVNVISIGSAVFTGLTIVTNRHKHAPRHADKPRTSVAIWPHLRIALHASDAASQREIINL